MIEFPSDDGTTSGYLARPEGEGMFPGLMVIQEWWGLVPHTKGVAERFAREGYPIYPGAGHAFDNDARPHILPPQAAQDAWPRKLDWFRKFLIQKRYPFSGRKRVSVCSC
jgi:dienelactone hydrolase